MKVSFKPNDSLYYIFKTIKKIPSYRKVILFIDPKHDFFENKRWGQQLKDIILQYNLDITCVVTNEYSSKYFKELKIPTIYKYQGLWQKWLQSAKRFLQKWQRLHSSLIVENTYISYLVIISEIVVIGFLLYFFRWLISPNATLTIQPSYHVENIVYNYLYYPKWKVFTWRADVIRIPYQRWVLPFKHQETINVQNISYDIENAHGTIEIFNTLPERISLLDKTKFIDDTGMLFTADTAINLAPGTPEVPSTTFISVTALPYTNQWEIIWELGNIPKDTTLWIKNLPESMLQKNIYALSTNDFKQWVTNATWTVIAEDITKMENKIIDYMNEKTKENLKKWFDQQDKKILFFDDFISLSIDKFITTSHIGDATSFIEWEVKASINFIYIEETDLITAVDTYLQERPSNNQFLVDYDENSLTFYDIQKRPSDDVFFIPTKLNTIRWYNFKDDHNNLIEEIKAKIVGMKRDEVKNTLLKYDDIQDVDISISPPRYDTMPQVKSRIKFKLKE